MTARASFLLGATLLFGPGCTERVDPLDPCAEEQRGWIVGAPVLGCDGTALALALSVDAADAGHASDSDDAHVVADGKTLLRISVRVGLEFQLNAAQVQLDATGGTFPSAAPSSDGNEPSTTTFTTGPEGTFTTLVRVATDARQLVLHASMKSQSYSGDAGAGVAETVVAVPLTRPELRQLVLSVTGSPELQVGGTAKVTARGYLEDDLRTPAAGAAVRFCVGHHPGLSLNVTETALGTAGEAEVTVLASEQMDPANAVTVRACPWRLKCEDFASPGCAESVPLTMKPKVDSIQKILLSSAPNPMKSGDERELSGHAYSRDDFSITAAAGLPIRFCVTGPALVEPGITAVGEKGTVTAKLRALAPNGASEEVQVVACPYATVCNAPSDACSAPVKVAVEPASPAISSMAISFVAPPLVEGMPSKVTVAAYADDARKTPAPANLPVRFCVDAAVLRVGASSGFLGPDGRAEVDVTALAGTSDGGVAVFTACPYDVPCVPVPTAPCAKEQAAIVPPPPDLDGGA